MVGSIRAITDSAGEVVARFEYEPFGLLTMSTGPMAAGAHRFTGKPEDEATELYYFGARYYDPEVGRFTSRDPAKDGLNWHTYCANNPLNRVDSNGNNRSFWFGNFGEAVTKVSYVLNGWEIVWTTNGHGPDFAAFDAATKQFAFVDAKAWLGGGTVSKLIWATGDNLKNWSTDVWNAVSENPGLSGECKSLAEQAFGPAGEWGKNVSKHIVGFSEFGKLYLSKGLQEMGGFETRTISFVDTLSAMMSLSLKNTLITPYIFFVPDEFIDNLPFGRPKAVRV